MKHTVLTTDTSECERYSKLVGQPVPADLDYHQPDGTFTLIRKAYGVMDWHHTFTVKGGIIVTYNVRQQYDEPYDLTSPPKEVEPEPQFAPPDAYLSTWNQVYQEQWQEERKQNGTSAPSPTIWHLTKDAIGTGGKQTGQSPL